MPGDFLTDQLGRVLSVVREVLGRDALGAYLHGSAVLGGLRPRSDIDVLVVSTRSTTREEKRRLVDRLLTVSGDPRPVELTIVVQSEVRPWRYPPRFDFQYGEWHREEFERGNIEPWPTTTNPDVASLITMVLLGNSALFGPPPADLLDPVPHGDYVDAIAGDLGAILAGIQGDTRNVLLTLARIWSTLATGEIRSKDAAADWALARLPDEHRPVLARARAVYLGNEEERWDDLQPRLRPHTDYIVAEIERLATATRRPPRP